jgi:transposase
MDNEQRLIGLERRRRRGVRLLAAGMAQADVARRVGVQRPTGQARQRDEKAIRTWVRSAHRR